MITVPVVHTAEQRGEFATMSNISERENMLLVLEGKKPAWLPSFTDACAFVMSPALGRKPDPKTGYLVDIFGVSFATTIDGPVPVNTKTGQFELADITKWKSVMPDVDLSKIDWEEDAKKVLSGFDREQKVINLNAGFIWEQMHYMMGFENALLSLATEPEAVYDFLNALADFWIDAMRRQHKYLKSDLIMVMEHVATARGMLLSPETYRKIIKPIHKKFCDAVIELGAIPEMHVDGCVEDILEDYADIGVKAIQPFQVFNDINAAKEKYGFIAIGGWDAFGSGNLPDSTEEDVRAAVRLAMDSYGPGYKYCFWASGVTPSFPGYQEWINDEAQTYGRSYYS